ncbi:movement protein [Bienertia sinuspersici]
MDVDCTEVSGDFGYDVGWGLEVIVHFWHGGYFPFELRNFGYQNVMMLWYKVPRIGISNSGLRPLVGVKDFDELEGYAYDGGVVRIYALHKVNKPQLVSLNELVGAQVGAKKEEKINT